MSRAIDLESKYIPEPNTGCWLWLTTLDRDGYGKINYRKRTLRAHRFIYERLRGPIPSNLELDHMCRVRCCVNPDHLEPVAGRENLRRGNSPSSAAARQTHCIHGHEFNFENTRIGNNYKGSFRQCRACETQRQKVKKNKKTTNLPIVRNSFSNPYIWGWHRLLFWEGVRRGVML